MNDPVPPPLPKTPPADPMTEGPGNSGATSRQRGVSEQFQALWQEVQVTFKACLAQGQRLFDYLMGSWRQRTLEGQLLEAQIALGKRVYELGQGDPKLRDQLDQLAEREKSVEAAKASTKLLVTERRGLYVRLAQPLLNQTAPAGLESEYQKAVDLKRQAAELQAKQAEKKSSLWPADNATRNRVVIGAVVLLVAMSAVGMAARTSVNFMWRVATPLPVMPKLPTLPDPIETPTPVDPGPRDPEPPQPAPSLPTPPSPQLCFSCNGTGQANCQYCFGSGKKTCFQCNGSGQVRNFSNANAPLSCQNCNGSGQQNCGMCQFGKTTCQQCGGRGQR